MATLIERAMGAAKLDRGTFEEIERDPEALGQAAVVVIAAALASGVGALDRGVAGVVAGTIGSLIAWLLWAGITYLIGTRVLPGRHTEADFGQVLRTLGFAAAPGVLGVLGVIPLLGALIILALAIWQLAAMVVAVRQVFDYETTGRAVGVCLLGFLAYVLVGSIFLSPFAHP